MVENAINKLIWVFTTIPFSFATWFVVVILLFFIWVLYKASKSSTSPVVWEHLIVDSSNDRTSPYKLGYLVGVIVSTWIVITFADGDKLTFDIFGTYLTFLLGGAGVNAFFKGSQTTSTE